MRVVALAALLAVAACGGPNLEPGSWAVVTELEYDDPDTSTSSVCVSYNPNGGCNVHVPVTSTAPERWIVHVRGTGNNDDITDTFEVSSERYHELSIGDEVKMP